MDCKTKKEISFFFLNITSLYLYKIHTIIVILGYLHQCILHYMDICDLFIQLHKSLIKLALNYIFMKHFSYRNLSNYTGNDFISYLIQIY